MKHKTGILLTLILLLNCIDASARVCVINQFSTPLKSAQVYINDLTATQSGKIFYSDNVKQTGNKVKVIFVNKDGREHTFNDKLSDGRGVIYNGGYSASFIKSFTPMIHSCK